MTKIKNEYLRCIVLFFIILFFQLLFSQLSFYIARITPCFIPSYTYFGASISHLFSFIVLLIICIFIKSKFNINLGLEINEHKKGLIYVMLAIIFAIVVQTTICIFDEPYIENSLTSYFIFQFFFSGSGEEILYRSLSLGLMLFFCKDASFKIKNHNIHIGIILSALLFSIGHINFGISPFYISFSITQLIISFLFGLFLGICYIRTKSVWYCMLAHGLYNCTLMIISLIVVSIK